MNHSSILEELPVYTVVRECNTSSHVNTSFEQTDGELPEQFDNVKVPKVHKKRHRKDRLASDAAVAHVTESNGNTGSNNWSRGIPVTADGEESEISDRLCYWNDEENENLCIEKDSSHLKRKKHKKERKVKTGDGMVLHEIPVIENGEELERSNEENKNMCTPKDSSYLRHKKAKHKGSKINTASSMMLHEMPVDVNIIKSESNTEENQNLLTQEDRPHLNQKKRKHKGSKAIYVAQSLQNSLLITQSEHEFACPTCLKDFNNRSNFVRHLLIHREEKDFSCTMCEKKFTLKQSLQVHMRSHTKEKPFKCAECSKAFSDANNLRRHMLIHNKVKEFVCDICSKGFSLKQQLEAHILKHKDVKLFPCPHCSKIFNYKYRLRIHLDTCKNLNPLICPICSKKFPRVYNLKRHMRTHE